MDQPTNLNIIRSRSQDVDWITMLSHTNPPFGGSKEIASILMKAFLEGILYVYEQTYETKKLVFPQISILAQVQIDDPIIFTTNKGLKICVTQRFLEQSTLLPLEKLQIMNAKGIPDLEVTPLDFFKLSGVEEGQHSFFMQNNSNENKKSVLLPSQASNIDYMSQDHEIEALKLKIQYAQSHNINPRTIEMLSQQLSDISKHLEAGASRFK